MAMKINVKKCCVLLGVSAAVGFTAYDSYKCVKILRKPLNTGFLNKSGRCEIIYIKHDYFREPVKDFLNEFFEEETLIYSLIYNIKRKLTFTKVG
jgi:hypothetical protein